MTFKAVGAYVFAGLPTIGLRQVGYDVLCHLEGDGGYGAKTAELNWVGPHYGEKPVYFGPSEWPLDGLREVGVDYLDCQPPCAIFSSCGISISQGRGAWRSDARLGCWYDCFNAFDALRPGAFSLESVCQAYTKGREVVDEFTKRSLMMGYSVTHLLVNALWMGVPQRRRRFFFVAHKPARLTGYALNWAPPMTIAEALTEVDEPGWHAPIDDKYIAAVRECKQAEGLREAWERINPGFETRRNDKGQIKGRPRLTDYRVPLDGQMGAFIGNSHLHPTEDRWLGSQEAKAICRVPLDYKLEGREDGWHSLLARSVMPPVAEWLGRVVQATLETPAAEWSERRVTMIDLREPGREEVDLTSRYLDDAGRVRLRISQHGVINYGGLFEDNTAHPRAKTTRARNAATVQDSRTAPREDGRQVHVQRVPEFSRPVGEPSSLDHRSDESPAEGSSTVVTPMGDEFIIRSMELPRAESGERSGNFIKRLLTTTDLDAGEIVVAVHGSYTGRKTRVSDVRFNHQALVSEGVGVRAWPRPNVPGQVNLRGQTKEIALVDVDSMVKRPKEKAPPLVFVKRGLGPLVAMTGCTGVQAKPRAHAQVGQRNDFPAHVFNALTELGCDVDWRPSRLGEGRREYDCVVAFLAPINGLSGVRWSFELLVLLAEARDRGVPVVVFYDDWSVNIIHQGLRGVTESVNGIPRYGAYFRKRWTTYAHDAAEMLTRGYVDRYEEQVKSIAGVLGGKWPESWVGAYPAYRWGDPKIVERMSGASRLVRIDPTPVSVNLNYQIDVQKERRWILAAINPYREWVEAQRPTWPIFWTGRKEYGPKLATEEDVLRETARSRAVFAPPYDSLGAGLDGSGWYRLRYVYAALSNGVLFTDKVDARALGEPYQLTVDQIERCSDAELDALAAAQRRHLLEGGLTSTTHEEWLADIKQIEEVLRG